MSNPLVLLHCSQLVTLAGPARPRVGEEMRELAIIPDGAIVIRNGRVSEVGSSSAIGAGLPMGCEIIDAGGRVVMPGFVDPHTHPVFAGNRADEFEMRAGGKTYQQIAATGGGIKSTVRKTRAATEEE